MKKVDIKATFIMLIYITIGVTVGYYSEQYTLFKGTGYVLGFVIGVLLCGFMQYIWYLIRSYIED